MSTSPFDRSDGDMAAQFHGMPIGNERFMKEAAPIPIMPSSEHTVKDILPLLTTAEDRRARIKAVLTPTRKNPSPQFRWLNSPGMLYPTGSSVSAWPIQQLRFAIAAQREQYTYNMMARSATPSLEVGSTPLLDDDIGMAMESDDLLSQPGGAS